MSTVTPIELIEAIVEQGNLTNAAQALFVSQPYLSKLLKKLEQDLGTPIFERLPRQMMLTFAGERYLDYLKKMAAYEKNMQAEIEMITQHTRGRIKLGINPALGSALLPKILPPFMRAYPGIEIELHEENAQTLEYLLENNLIDLGIGMGPSRNPLLSHQLLYEDQMHLLVPRGEPIYNPEYTEITPFPYELEVLNDLNLILLNKSYGIRRVVDDFFQRFGLTERIVLEVGTIYTAIGLSQKGVGSTFIPVTGMSWAKRTDSNVYAFSSDTLTSQFVIMYLTDRTLSPTLKNFITMTQSILADEKKRFRLM